MTNDPDPWQRATAALHELWDARHLLDQDRPATVERVRQQFSPGGDRMLALYLLPFLEDECTLAVIDEVLRSYLSEGSRPQAFEVLARLGRRDLEEHLPRAVWRLLEEELHGDDRDNWLPLDYETFAQLFGDLGLASALPELARRALASDHPGVRSTGERIRKDYLSGPAAAPSAGQDHPAEATAPATTHSDAERRPVLEGQPVLGGRPVRLRPGGAGDAAALHAILGEEPVARWWGEPEPLAQVEADLRGDGDTVLLVIEIGGEVAGGIQYTEEDDPMYRHAGIDIFLGGRFQDRGAGREAVKVLARFLFEQRGHHRLTIDPAAANERAIRAYTAVGFRPVGVMRQYERGPDGSFHDGLLMDLLAGELTGA